MKNITILILLIVTPVIVFAYPIGDVNGDGSVKTSDYLLIRKHILKKPELTGDELIRADLNYDGNVTARDYIDVRRIIMGVYAPMPTPTPTPTKKVNPIEVTVSQSKSLTYATSNKDITFTAASKAQGTVTYTIQSQKNSYGTNVSSFTIPTKETASVRMASKTTSGVYTVVVRAKAAGNTTYESGYKDITLTITVKKASNPISVVARKTWESSYSESEKTVELNGAINAVGSVTYSIQSQTNSSGTSISSFSLPTDGKPTLKKAAKTGTGTYTVVIRATAKGDVNYKSGYKDITVDVRIDKITNPISVTGSQSKSTTYSTSNKDIGFTAATGGKGSVTYTIQSQKNSSGTSISSFTIPTASKASVRMNAKTSAGIYTIVIRAKAAGNNNYNSGTKDITLKLTVLPSSENKFSPVDNIKLSKTSFLLTKGTKTTFDVTLTKALGTFKVTSDKPSIAKLILPIDSEGINCTNQSVCFIDALRGSESLTITVEGVAKGEAHIKVEALDIELSAGGQVKNYGTVGVLVN